MASATKMSCEHWEERLKRYTVSYERILYTGSSAIFDEETPRASELSLNRKRSAVPNANLIEQDVTVCIPEGENPWSWLRLFQMQRALGAKLSQKIKMSLWDEERRVALLYAYDKQSEGTYFEYEFHVVAEPYLEVTQFWLAVFNPEEVAKQKELRKILRELGEKYVDDYRALKSFQYDECRRRVLLSYLADKIGDQVIEGLSRDIIESLPLRGDAPELVKRLLQQPESRLWREALLPISAPARRLLAGLYGTDWDYLGIKPQWLRWLEALDLRP